MEQEKIISILAQAYESAYREYQTLMALGTQLLKDGKHETYHEVAWYANGKLYAWKDLDGKRPSIKEYNQ